MFHSIQHKTLSLLLKTVFTLVLAGTYLSASSSARAEDDMTLNENFLLYISENLSYEAITKERAMQMLKILDPECNKIDRLVRQIPIQYTDIQFPKKIEYKTAPPHPEIGQWKDITKIKACGNIHTINFMVTASRNEDPLVLPLLPGDTILEPFYQMSTEMRVRERLDSDLTRNCVNGGETYILDTKVLGFIQDNKKLGPDNHDLGWFEEWLAWHCTKIERVHVAVIINDLGTRTFSIKTIGQNE